MSLWFVVPAHGRLELSAICLRQLRRTCDRLTDEGIEATAVVIADDENLDTARNLGFGTVERDNEFLSRKYNDGIQLALDPDHNPRPADHVVPCGSDDWVDASLFLELPPPDTMIGFQRMCFVREDGRQIAAHHLDYLGGCGIRIWPRELMRQVHYRPASESRQQGCDTSILYHTRAVCPQMRIVHANQEPWTIVDWKSPDRQVTPYDQIDGRHPTLWTDDPFDALLGLYPPEALAEMRAHYARALVTA